ncbi:uncharacterized protein LOC121049035 [Rosa chinensis]|uniref:uncharacterized protein LOC121049035 n=1 Tax=Rosa chinensis TaxID=74649 RepID=UPI001AD8D97A|nr:uncharacterized protein LOC121049035 [Rosa chinensis]
MMTASSSPGREPGASNSPLPAMLVRSRSEGEIEAFLANKRRKEELVGTISKQWLMRTSSTIAAPSSKMCSSSMPRHSLFRNRSNPMKNMAGGCKNFRPNQLPPMSSEKLQREVSYLQNDNTMPEKKQKELKATIHSLLQSMETFVNAYEIHSMFVAPDLFQYNYPR